MCLQLIVLIIAYASICQCVTEIVIKTQSNGTQYVCHPRFQPWGSGGFPYKDIYSVHCGYALGMSLVMELQSDGHYKYFCQYFSSFEGYRRCLILSSQQGYLKCLFCKFPYSGYYCNDFNFNYDQRQTDPPRRCFGNCIECSEQGECLTCRYGYAKSNSLDTQCNLYCQGFQSCYRDGNGNIVYSSDCQQGYIKSQNYDPPYCAGNYLPCQSPYSWNNSISCNSCQDGYFLKYKYPDNWSDRECQQYDWNCHPFRQQTQNKVVNSGYFQFYTICNQCDPGFYFNEGTFYCTNVRFSKPNKNNCILLDPQGNNCIACLLQYALQPDGTCKEVVCDQKCSTCLDTNPSYCITLMIVLTLQLVIVWKIKQLIMVLSFNLTLFSIFHFIHQQNQKQLQQNQTSNTCICLPNSGMAQDNCITCTEGFCNQCDQLDFYSCIDYFLFLTIFHVNREKTEYQPINYMIVQLVIMILEMMIKSVLVNYLIHILVCDYTCFNCNGPTYQDCTECPDENTTNRIKIENACPCKTGYADLAIKESKCGPCHPRCKTCFQAADQTSNQYCLKCIPGQNRVVSETFNCECQVNSGDLNGTLDVCIICHYTCGSCNGTKNTDCVQCSESSNRELTTTGECLCKLSYYDDETENIECQKCHYSCITCENSTEKDACSLCPPTRKPSYSGSKFECICSSENYFDDGFSSQCQQCDQNCLTCNGPLPSNCLTCDIHYRQMDLSSCICPTRHYDIGFLECAKCHYSCQQCFDNTFDSCIVCSLELNFRVLKGNICKCIDGYYEESGIAQCKKCSYRCETCETSAEKCLTCPLNSLRILDPSKGCYCPGEYYDKQEEIACQRCHFKCKTCDGKDQNNCLACDSVANREFHENECKCKPHYFEMEVQECTSCSAFCYNCYFNQILNYI